MKLPTLMPLSVKQNTVRRVIEAILDGDADTRNGLAEHLQISSMTVGKVVRALLQVGLLDETAGKAVRGRAPVRLVVSDLLTYAVLSITPQGFSVCLTSSTGQTRRRMDLPYNHALELDANLICLRRLLEEQLRLGERRSPYYAIGMLLPPNFGVQEPLFRSILCSDAVSKTDVTLGIELRHAQELAMVRALHRVVAAQLSGAGGR